MDCFLLLFESRIVIRSHRSRSRRRAFVPCSWHRHSDSNVASAPAPVACDWWISVAEPTANAVPVWPPGCAQDCHCRSDSDRLQLALASCGKLMDQEVGPRRQWQPVVGWSRGVSETAFPGSENYSKCWKTLRNCSCCCTSLVLLGSGLQPQVVHTLAAHDVA